MPLAPVPYVIIARRRARGWDLVDGVEILTQTTTLTAAAAAAAVALAAIRGGEPEDYNVDVVVDLAGTEKKVQEIKDQMLRAQAELQRAATEWRTVAAYLRDVEKLPASDAAVVLGISAGRYSQLVRS